MLRLLVSGLLLCLGACAGPRSEPRREGYTLPGIHVDVEARQVDIDAEVCLREGSLELIASTKAGRVHESIVAVLARPTHIHAALLLLGLNPGTPARRQADAAGGIIDVPPRGDRVRVALVIDGIERPLRDFVRRAGAERGELPTDTFLFAGSQLIAQKGGPDLYACEMTGNVISLSTFGDEVLCLAGVHTREDGQLPWEVDSRLLPEVGRRVVLRLGMAQE